MISYTQSHIADLKFQARYFAFEGNYTQVKACLITIAQLKREA